MYRLILLFTLSLLVACSADEGMKYVNKTPRGLSAMNITQEQRVKAYRTAEIHCAKYSKVTRIMSSKIQSKDEIVPKSTIVFECVKPSNKIKKRLKKRF